MNEVLKIFLSLSISGSILILIMFLCKPLFKEKFSKVWQYYIWLIVIARLLLPFAPETNLVRSFFEKMNYTTLQTDITLQQQQDNIILSETDFFENNNLAGNKNNIKSEGQINPSTHPAPNILAILVQNLWLIWLIIAFVLLIRKITIYQSFANYIRAGQTLVSDIELWEQFGGLVKQANVKKTIALYTNSLISSPLLIGFFRPCIVLSSTDISNSDFQYTIFHELTHYKRWDMLYKWLVQIVVCLHWFNPIIYIMSHEINRACELSCDEVVIRKLDIKEQRAYGNTLLNAMRTGGNYKDSLVSITLSESKEL